MSIKKKAVLSIIDGIINRLEDILANATVMSDQEDVSFEDDDFDDPFNESDEVDGPETSFLLAEDRIEEMAQSLNEEIENLRAFADLLEEKLD